MNYFLVIFIDFLIFLIQIQIWILGPVATAGYRYRTPAVAAVTAVYRAVTNGKENLAGRPSGSNIEEEKQDERWIVGSTASHALPSTSNRPLPHSCPPFPKGGSQEKITEWNRACLRIYKLGANGCLVCSYS
jgi:hypothetical protein